MEYLANQIKGINTLFIQLDEELSFLLENQDEIRRERLAFLVNTIEEKREELKNKYDDRQLKQFNPFFQKYIDSVRAKLARLISQKNKNIEDIKFLLKISSNRKKMAAYKK